MLQTVETTVSAPGGAFYVKRWSVASGQNLCPIILFHDSIGCVEMWRQFPANLATALQRPVIACDRLGFGKSSPRFDLPSAGFVTEEAEKFFPLLKNGLGLRNYILFGHSVGGAMAVVAAGLFPGECQGVITESAQAYVEERTLSAIRAAKERFKAPNELAKLEKFHGAKARWVVNAWTETWLSPEFADWSLREDLAQVQCPLLAIHGDRDEYGSDAFPEVLASTRYGEKLIVPNCGHIPHKEHEKLVIEQINEFLTHNLADLR
jgi:pimeloyl-ACP methyl ester carboxylesterase